MMLPNRIAILMLISLWIGGCAIVVAGAGAGAGVYTWVKGELIRDYSADFEQTLNACTQSLEYLKITVDERTGSSGETDISARRSDGTPVALRVRAMGERRTEVSVRCGLVGYWDRETAELIHVTIASNI